MTIDWKKLGETAMVVAAPLVVAGAAVAVEHFGGAKRNPRRTRRSAAEIETLAEEVIREAGQAGGIDEVQAIAKKGWPDDGRFTRTERAAIKREAKRKMRELRDYP